MLCSRRRIELPLPFASWLRQATAPDMLTLLPLTAEVVIASNDLPANFHADPADRMIVATARAHGLPLATHDKVIRRSRLVKVWSPRDSASRETRPAARKVQQKWTGTQWA